MSSPNSARQAQIPTESAANEKIPPHRPRQESESQLLEGSHILRRHSAPQTSLSIAYPGLRRETPFSLTDIYASYFDDDIGAPQGTGRLLDLQHFTTVQPSESRLQDTVSPCGTFDQDSATDNLHAGSETTQSPTTASDKQPVGWEERKSTSHQLEESKSNHQEESKSDPQEESKSDPQEERTSNQQESTSDQQEKSKSNQEQESRSNQNQKRTSNPQEQQSPSEISMSSTEVKSSATATGSEAQEVTTPRNAMQPLRHAHMVDSGNASESPNQVIDTLRPLSELKHTNAEVSGTTQHPNITTSEGEPSVADEGNTGNTTTLQPSPEIQQVNANLSGGSNDPERRLSSLEVDPLVADLAAADSSQTAQTLRKPSTILTHDEVDLSVGSAETSPGNISSSPSSDQATTDGIVANRDASFGKDPPVSGFKGFFARAAGIFKMTPSYTKDEIIGMAAHDYTLEHLKNGIAVDEFNHTIKQWKEFEDSIVREEVPFLFPDPLDYGKEWQAFYALQIWYYEQWHREKNGRFPPGYKTLFDSSEDEILNRSLPAVFRVSKSGQTPMRDDGRKSCHQDRMAIH